MNQIITLAVEFFKVGLFTFGGGYAMIPILQEVVIETYKWTNPQEFVDIIAIAESTPGVIAVNMATLLGTRVSGSSLGGVITTLAVVMPSFVIVLIVTHYYYKFKDSEHFEKTLRFIRLGVPGIIATAVLTLSKGALMDWFGFVILAASVYLSLVKKVNPIIIIILSGFLGAIVY